MMSTKKELTITYSQFFKGYCKAVYGQVMPTSAVSAYVQEIWKKMQKEIEEDKHRMAKTVNKITNLCP